MAAVAVWIGWAVTVGDPDPFHGPLILLMISAFLTLSGGNLLNDLVDIDVDRRIHPDRPLASGLVAPQMFRIGVIVLWVISLFLTTTASYMEGKWEPLLILDVVFISLLWYELDLKNRGLPGNIAISLLTGLTFLFGSSILGEIPAIVIIFALMASAMNLSREMIKDIEDVEGDIFVRETFPMRNGMDNAVFLARIVIAISILLSIMPLFIKDLNLAYMVIVAISDIFFVNGALLTGRDPSSSQIRIKIGMVFALIAFFSYATI